MKNCIGRSFSNAKLEQKGFLNLFFLRANVEDSANDVINSSNGDAANLACFAKETVSIKVTNEVREEVERQPKIRKSNACVARAFQLKPDLQTRTNLIFYSHSTAYKANVFRFN